MKIVFHGEDTWSFADRFGESLQHPGQVDLLPMVLGPADAALYAAAEVIVTTRFQPGAPATPGLKLLHSPAAGYDGIHMASLPPGAAVCNCFGHEQPIAEYVMAALLARHVPLRDADARLRQGDWAYWAGDPVRVHGELADTTIGLLGFGHIGKAIAGRARAFGMGVLVANRSPVAASPLFDRAFGLHDPAFWSGADAIVVSLPLSDDTKGLVGAAELGAMRPDAVIINVGRGPVIDEAALYDALSKQRIGGAVIDTWYQYPSAAQPQTLPSALPFHTLPNLVMTPHMSGWTAGTIRRRRDQIARNVNLLARGETLENLVRAPLGA